MSKAKLRIQQNDTVLVISGKDRGKVGRVLRVLPAESRVVVEGVAEVKRHQKPVGDQPGSIVTKSASVHISNVALWNSAEGRRVRVGYEVADNGKKIRVDRKSRTAIENG